MRYSTLAKGKRLRPVLAILTAELFGQTAERIAPVAGAIELIHSYSLIHDDLPCMDDDDFRRGMPTCHKAFGEAIAVLAGDALLTCAFEMIIQNGTQGGFGPGVLLEVIGELSRAAGSRGMIAGQVEDIECEGQEIDIGRLEYIHAHKTGKLFTASVRAGALLAGAPQGELEALTRFGALFGQVFQITDDILDVEGDTAEMGKTSGSDQRKKKATYPRILSMEKSKQLAAELVEQAVTALAPCEPRAAALIELVRYLPARRA
ncbi:MAG: polyprenyl synthetase family protein [Candidatus Wallbacteria bacterium]|nr:polyprenyl synthetase family protein [Candidatus Wallbacteria bacterium]